MALQALLYRCAFCGDEGMRTSAGRVQCPGCERSYREGSGGARVIVERSGEAPSEFPVVELVRRLEAMGGQAVNWEGAEADATMRVATRELPVREAGALIGFFEALGPRRKGRVLLDREAVVFSEVQGVEHRWPLLELRALQSSSSSVQISPRAGGVVTFRFGTDSPRRWEEFLRRALREAWAQAGRGEIREFQPRIRVDGPRL